MSDRLAVGEFARWRGVVTVVADVAIVGGKRCIALIDSGGMLHHWSWSEMSNGEWPSTLEAADPGKERGALNKQLKKYRRKHGKAL